MSFRTARFAAALSVMTLAPETRADLPEDADRLVARYRALGADVVALRPRFVSSGTPLWVSVPLRFLELEANECTTLTVLGAVPTVFTARTPNILEASDAPPEVIQSRAGMIALRRCGDAAGGLFHVVVRLRSPHAIVETVVAKTARALPGPEEVLRHRNPGTSPDLVRPGPPPAPAPLERRVEAAAARLLRDSAEVTRSLVRTDGRGGAQIPVDLVPGCHQWVISSELDPRFAAPPDIDAELLDASGDTVDSDPTESPDAALTTCAGEHRTLVVRFTGAAPGKPAAILHGTTPLPPYSPAPWGTEARARLGRALLDRSFPAPQGVARFASLGVSGTTLLASDLEPGQCYLAGLMTLQGSARLLSLHLTVGKERYRAASDDDQRAALVTFCAGATPRANIDIEVHGAALAWGMALWPLSRLSAGENTW